MSFFSWVAFALSVEIEFCFPAEKMFRQVCISKYTVTFSGSFKSILTINVKRKTKEQTREIEDGGFRSQVG